MKIGVLTYYGDLNCGTNLQAYATYKAVKKVYPNDNVEVVLVHTFDAIGLFSKYMPFIAWFFYHKIKAKYLDFKRNKLNVDNDILISGVNDALRFINKQNYEKIFVGADTLLELDRIPKDFDGLSAYWLKDIEAHKYLLAASAKNVEFANLSEKQKNDIKEAAHQFEGISVRDRATFRLFSNVIEESRIQYISDPTFTLNIDYSSTERYLKMKGIVIPKNSVLIHAGFMEKWPNEIVKKLHALGYKVFTPRYNYWSDVCLNDMSPLEQLGIYRYFKFVITHRFHDCVFCMKNSTPVMVYVKEQNVMMTQDGDSKQISILKDFDLYPNAFLGCSQDTDFLDFDWDEKIRMVENSFNPLAIKEKIVKKEEDYFDFLNSTK